jgi:hypothetical protein
MSLHIGTQAMTAIETAPAQAPAARHGWLRTALALVAAYQLIEALSNAPLIFADYHHATAYLRFAQALVSVKLALDPLVAATALMFAVRGRPREAILALAAFILIGWLLDDLWSFPIHGLELSLDYGGFVVFVHHFVFPAAAIAGAALALKDRRLALAGLLVCFPTLFDLAGILTFTVSIMLYGF